MDRNLLLCSHEKVVTRGIKHDKSSFLVEAQPAFATTVVEVDDNEEVVMGNSEGEITRRVQDEVVDGALIEFRELVSFE